VTLEKVVIRSHPTGYIDIAIFEQWLIEIFIPEFRRRREFHGYDGRAEVILDDSSSHGTERPHALCRENNVFPLFLSPYTSNQLQPLDLSLFGPTK
jgi:transposase